LKDKGTTVMFLGYAKNHSGNVFRFFKFKTMRVVLRRDVIWLNQLYYHYKNSLKMRIQSVMDIESDVYNKEAKAHPVKNQDTTNPGMRQEEQEG
jgi:hypothetical protein